MTQEEQLQNLARTTQLRPSILEADAPQVIKSFERLERKVISRDPNWQEQEGGEEWRTTIFHSTAGPSLLEESCSSAALTVAKEDGGSGNSTALSAAAIESSRVINSFFRDQTPLELSAHFTDVRAKPRTKVVAGIEETEVEVQLAAASVVKTAWELIAPRVERLLVAVAESMPETLHTLKLGADVTIRRTSSDSHDVTPNYEKHDDSAVHSDSWDGTVLGFALVSTKLGTPSYPVNTQFPEPLAMFLSQSRTGRNDAHQLDEAHIGPLRPWKPGTLVVMPAAVAHSKPGRLQIQQDPDPDVPRWFCRATLRVHVTNGFWTAGKTVSARERRLALALLVAEHVWGDANFASAARKLAAIPYSVWGTQQQNQRAYRLHRHKEQQEVAAARAAGGIKKVKQKHTEASLGDYEGDTVELSSLSGADEPRKVRHGIGKLRYANGSQYVGDWSHGKKHGQGTFSWTDGRSYRGAWLIDKRTGVGAYTFANGHTWTGVFNSGIPDDQRTYDAMQKMKPATLD